MLKIPGADGKTYIAPSWTSFKRWTRRGWIAYAILAVACTLGIYFYSQDAQRTTIDKINQAVVASCLANLQPDSTINKFNSLVDAIVAVRSDSYRHDLLSHDKVQAKIDGAAVRRYAKLHIPITTKEECTKPLLRR